MLRIVSVCLGLILPTATAQAQSIDEAFDRLLNFDFSGAQQILDRLETPAANEPLFHVTRASVSLFAEMDRLGILASEFFVDDGEKLARRNSISERLVQLSSTLD